MIHPAFAEIGEPTLAAVCSEAYDEDNAYTFATDLGTIARYGDGFPPVPAQLVGTTLSFINGGEVRSMFAPVHATEADVPRIVELYERTVGGLQDQVPSFAALTAPVAAFNGSFEGMQQAGLQEVARLRKRLVAAHIIVRNAEDREMIDTLVVPRSMGQVLPLILRDAYSSGTHLREELPPVGRMAYDVIIGPLLRREAAVAKVGDVVAASLLPEVAKIRTNFGM